jgi:hypothetical protein
MPNPYYHMQRGPIATSRDDSEHLVAKTDISATNSPATSTTTYRNSLNAHDNLGTTDYFPNLIDTSMPSSALPMIQN